MAHWWVMTIAGLLVLKTESLGSQHVTGPLWNYLIPLASLGNIGQNVTASLGGVSWDVPLRSMKSLSWTVHLESGDESHQGILYCRVYLADKRFLFLASGFSHLTHWFQFHPLSWKRQFQFFFMATKKSQCVYVPTSLYPFRCQQTCRLVSLPGCCKWRSRMCMYVDKEYCRHSTMSEIVGSYGCYSFSFLEAAPYWFPWWLYILHSHQQWISLLIQGVRPSVRQYLHPLEHWHFEHLIVPWERGINYDSTHSSTRGTFSSMPWAVNFVKGHHFALS